MKKIIKKTTEKYITEKVFENNMQAIAKSFQRLYKSLVRHELVLENILTELRNMHEDNKQYRRSIAGLNNEGISYERRIENLTFRVEKLESKVK